MKERSASMKLLMFGRTLILALVLSLLTSPIVREQKTECNVRITLLQVNDVYQFMPVPEHGGIGRVHVTQTIQPESKYAVSSRGRHYLPFGRIDNLQGCADDRRVEHSRTRLCHFWKS